MNALEITMSLSKFPRICINKNSKFLNSRTEWRDFRPETTYEMQRRTGTENLKNQDTILNVTSCALHFVGDSLVHDTIDKNWMEGAKVLQQVDKKFIPIVMGTTLAIIDHDYSGLCIVH